MNNNIKLFDDKKLPLDLAIRFAFIKENKRLKASEISKVLDFEYSRREINRYLYSHINDYEIDESYYWREKLKETIFNDKVFSKLQNRENAKTFTIQQFNKIANWSVGKSHSNRIPIKYKTKKGNIIECDSKSEVKMLEYMESHNVAQEIGGQSLGITYRTAFRNSTYYPDLIMLTNERYIAIIEVKSVSNMSYHMNIEKYNALKKYCIENNYLFMMIDPDNNFISFEDMRDMPVCPELIDQFDELNKSSKLNSKYCVFDKNVVDDWYNEFGIDYYLNKTQFYNEVKSMIIYYNWYNVSKYGFEVYYEPIRIDKRISLCV